MIPFGHLQVWKPKSMAAVGDQMELLSGKGFERMDGFTIEQKYTFITMRALAASPLFMGGDLLTSDDLSFELITNKEMIACNQNGDMGRLVYREDDVEAWSSQANGHKEKGWIGIFNRSMTPKSLSIELTQLGLNPNSEYVYYDIWQRGSLVIEGASIHSLIQGDGVLFFAYEAVPV